MREGKQAGKCRVASPRGMVNRNRIRYRINFLVLIGVIGSKIITGACIDSKLILQRITNNILAM